MHEAAIPNPALEPLSMLIGEWKTEATHPYFANRTFHGHASFNWIEGGAFILMHSGFNEEGIPSGIAIYGSDDATGEYFMLYFDERKVSRKYEVSMHDNVLKWWRNAPGFSQRYSYTFVDNGDTIMGKGELSRNGTDWEKDLEIKFTRLK